MSPVELFSKTKLLSPSAFSAPPLGCLADIPNIVCPKLNSWSPSPATPQRNLPFLWSSLAQEVVSPSFKVTNLQSLNLIYFRLHVSKTCQLYPQNISLIRPKFEIRRYPVAHPLHVAFLVQTHWLPLCGLCHCGSILTVLPGCLWQAAVIPLEHVTSQHLQVTASSGFLSL